MNISGTVYSDAGTTPMGAGRTVNVSVNGAASSASTTTASDGTFTLAGVTAASGAVLTVYLQGNTELGAVVTRSTGADMAGVNLYQDHLILRSDGGSLSTTNMNTSDTNGASGIIGIYTSSSTLLTMASGKKLLLPAGHTFAPATVLGVSSSGDITILGTSSSGRFGSVTLTGGSTRTVAFGSIQTGSFTVNASGGTVLLGSDLSLVGNVALTAGGLDVTASNYTVTFTGGWTRTGGTFNPRQGTVVCTGSGTFNGDTTFYNLTFAPPGVSNRSFAAGGTTTVTNAADWQGHDGVLVNMGSVTPGSAWNVVMPSAQTLAYLNVSDSNNTGVTAAAGATSVDGGGNTNWTFGAAPPVAAGPGLEHTLPEARSHHTPPVARLHHAPPDARLHHTLPEED